MNHILIWSVILLFSMQAIIAVGIIRVISEDSLIKKIALGVGIVDIFVFLTSMIEVIYAAFGVPVGPMRLLINLGATATTMVIFWSLRSWQEKKHDRP
ncbi:hypothetical protein A6M27_01780 [Acidithiobacillus thiooxidans]|uniref:Uncharacterized protein n=1 Tax=Acidithiobacillus thiooxidans TaxID=930 RepID=A0A1C2J017_ACITH|nr:hypothetical protein [Acidithiobacillus thiooxidans]OCX67501.1 hypothetical protein A6P07_19930 [Acidithiobacillus thiooxidans]OCX73131.1 hypothetical protein A6O24_12515 [Acidithiobacillus thiooxidans]OCX81529.1 hypothetical protein A6O26_13120 [Acidithiobacillus thiooxidans]OCX89476.1 hypothetical protein A6M27_01780 [Acidithiobacillus thiooxidans]OFC50699.1 hypothetical protein BAE47_01245 [Acidithiobacillus thiooxidans]